MLNHHGFKAKLTPRSWDKGCDLVAWQGNTKVLVQCKQVRSDSTLTNGVEQVLNASSHYSDAAVLLLVTNAKKITRAQRELAAEQSVVLCLGKTLSDSGRELASKLTRALRAN